MIDKKKTRCYNLGISEQEHGQKGLFNLVHKIANEPINIQYPKSSSDGTLANSFLSSKIDKIVKSFHNSSDDYCASTSEDARDTCFIAFDTLSEEQVRKYILAAPTKVSGTHFRQRC